MRAVPLVASVLGVLLFGRGRGSRGPEARAAPAVRPPPRRRPRPAPAPAQRASAHAKAAAALSTLCALLSVALCAAVVRQLAHEVLLALAAGNALCAAAAAALCVRAMRSTPAQQSARVATAAVPHTPERLLGAAIEAVAPLYSGVWHKDFEASGPMEEAMDLIQLSWLLRQAVRLITGLELRLSAETFDFAVCSKLKWFKIRESFTTDGEPRRNTRRDLRGGGALGRVTVTPRGLLLTLEWEDPLAGCERLLFTVSPDGGSLNVRSKVVLRSGPQCVYTTVYRRG